jgi:hypothetical protein
VWDALFSTTNAAANRLPLIEHLCVAMIREVRRPLLAGCSSQCLELLIRFPPVDVDACLSTASHSFETVAITRKNYSVFQTNTSRLLMFLCFFL